MVSIFQNSGFFFHFRQGLSRKLKTLNNLSTHEKNELLIVLSELCWKQYGSIYLENLEKKYSSKQAGNFFEYFKSQWVPYFNNGKLL